MADQYMMVFDGEIIDEGGLEHVLKSAEARVADEGMGSLEEAKARLLRVVEVPIKLVPARGPSIELAKAPRAPRTPKEEKPAMAAIQCPIEGCTAPGGSRRRGFCEKHWALVPKPDRARKLPEAEDRQRLVEIVQAAMHDAERR